MGIESMVEPRGNARGCKGNDLRGQGLEKRGNRSECMGDLAGKQARITWYGEQGGMYEQNQYTGECSRIALNKGRTNAWENSSGNLRGNALDYNHGQCSLQSWTVLRHFRKTYAFELTGNNTSFMNESTFFIHSHPPPPKQCCISLYCCLFVRQHWKRGKRRRLHSTRGEGRIHN